MNEPRKITRLDFEKKLELMAWLRRHDEELAQTTSSFMAVATSASNDLKFPISGSAVQSVVNLLRKKGEPLKYTGFYKLRQSRGDSGPDQTDVSRQKVWRLEKKVEQLEGMVATLGLKLLNLYTKLGEKYNDEQTGR